MIFFITIIYLITSSSTPCSHHPYSDISHHHQNPYHHHQFLPENNEISHLSAVGSNFLRQLVRTVVDCHSIKWTAASIIIIIRNMVLILIEIVNFLETLILLVDHMSCLSFCIQHISKSHTVADNFGGTLVLIGFS